MDYTSASGSTIAAAVRGLPVKLVFISSSKPQFELMSQPQIKSVQDLKGKIVGISSRGGSNDLMLQMILQKNGLAPNKDVTTIIVGAQEESVIAVRTGRITAALITPPKTSCFNATVSTVSLIPATTCPPVQSLGTQHEQLTRPAEILRLIFLCEL